MPKYDEQNIENLIRHEQIKSKQSFMRLAGFLLGTSKGVRWMPRHIMVMKDVAWLR